MELSIFLMDIFLINVVFFILKMLTLQILTVLLFQTAFHNKVVAAFIRALVIISIRQVAISHTIINGLVRRKRSRVVICCRSRIVYMTHNYSLTIYRLIMMRCAS